MSDISSKPKLIPFNREVVSEIARTYCDFRYCVTPGDIMDVCDRLDKSREVYFNSEFVVSDDETERSCYGVCYFTAYTYKGRSVSGKYPVRYTEYKTDGPGSFDEFDCATLIPTFEWVDFGGLTYYFYEF